MIKWRVQISTLLVSLLVLPVTSTAWATDAPAAVETSVRDLEASPDELEAQFTSLTSALLNYHATQSGQTLDSYLAANELMVFARTGQQPAVLLDRTTGSRDGAQRLTATSPSTLDAQLADAGFGLDLRSYSSLQQLALDVVSNAHTADASVTLAGAQWAGELAKMRSPGIHQPVAGRPTAPPISQEGLAFGLLLDQALARTVLTAPDLLAQVQKTGTGSPALSTIFAKQMDEAWTASSKSLTAALPNKCTGAMLAVMATGNPQSADEYGNCPPSCTTGGYYLHGQTMRLFGNPAGQLKPDTSNQIWTYETFLSLPPHQMHALLEQNPALVQGILAEDGTGGGAKLCADASRGTAATLQNTLPGVFGSLKTVPK